MLKDFFFPKKNRLKIEAITRVFTDPKTQKRVIQRRFYTFRALATFSLWYVTKNPYEQAKKRLEEYREQPVYAFRLAGLTAFLLLVSFSDIAHFENITLVAGSIAFDATTNRTNETGASTTFSHTVTGTNPVITVAVASYRGLSSCTYNSVGMTLGVNASQGQAKSGVYYYGNPATGAHNVVFTPTSSGTDDICAISFSGADTTTPNGVTGTNVGTNSDTLSKSVTTTRANSFLVDAFATEEDPAHVYGPDAGQTQRMWGQNNFWIGGGASTKPTTSVGSYTMGWTKSSGSQANNLSISVLEIKEYVASGPANVKTVNGLAIASVKSMNDLAIASVKSINDLT